MTEPLEPPARDLELPVPGRRLGILFSGRGTNMMQLVAATQDGSLDADTAVVLSNRPKAPGIEAAREAGVPVEVLSHRRFPDRESFDRAVVEILRRYEVDLVCLAGFMRILSPVMLEAFPYRIVNLHPSLLPSFPGLKAHDQALEEGVKVSGATVHLVDQHLDHGPIVMQGAVPVRDDDTPETLAARVLEVEHRILPEAVRRLRRGGYRLRNRSLLRQGPD